MRDAVIKQLAEHLSFYLYEAGKKRAQCMVPKSGPTISFAEWTERNIRKALAAADDACEPNTVV